MKRRILATILAIALCFNYVPCYAAEASIETESDAAQSDSDEEIFDDSTAQEKEAEDEANEISEIEVEKVETSKSVMEANQDDIKEKTEDILTSNYLSNDSDPDECIHDYNDKDVCTKCGTELQPFEYFTLNKSEAILTGYIGKNKNIVIPEIIDGYYITYIDGTVFNNCDNIETIKISNQVKGISGENVFPSGCYLICEKDSYAYSYAVSRNYTVYWDYLCEEHTYSGDSIIEKTPTHAHEGLMTRECMVCGFIKSESIPAEGHIFDENDTCTICGNTKEQALFEADFEIESSYDYCRITAYKGDAENLVIPEYIDGLKVFWIGDYSNPIVGPNSNLKSITCNHDYVNISEHAFDGCTSLEYVYLLGKHSAATGYSFRGCSNLKEFYHPYNDSSWIYLNTFNGCKSLTDFTIGEEVTSIGSSAFEGCSGLTNIEIPWKCDCIYYDAFKNCSSLSDVTIWNDSAYIGDDVFLGCSSDLVIHGRANSTAQTYAQKNNIAFEPLYTCVEHSFDKVTVIDNAGCTYSGTQRKTCSICNYTVEEIIPKFGHQLNENDICIRCGCPVFEAYYGNDPGTCILARYNGNSEHVIVPEKINGRKVVAISSGTFSYNEDIVSVELPDSITDIRVRAFYNCKNLETIHLPKKLECISGWAFSGCTKLTRIEIPDSVNYIGTDEAAFDFDNITFVCRENSYAHICAKNNGIPFEISGPAYTDLTVDHDYCVKGYEIETNEVESARIPFVPEITGTYVFSSYNSDQVSLCTLYDVNHQSIPGYFSSNGNNFSFSVMLEGGKTYYLDVYGETPYLPAMFVNVSYICAHEPNNLIEIVEKEPTCIELGFSVYVCDLCGENVREKYLPFAEHQWVDNYCIVCNEKYIEQGNNYGSTVTIGSSCNIGVNCSIGAYTNIGSACNIGSYSNIGSACNIGSYANIGSACNIGSYGNIGSACNIGSYSNIGSACNIGSYSNIGSACNIGSATNIGSSCNIGSATNIGTNTIIGTECSIGIFGVIGENCVIGSGVIVGDHVVIGSNTNIADGYVIKDNTVVAEGSSLGFDEEDSITIDGCSLTAYDTGVIGMNYYVSLPQHAVDQGYKAVLYSEENAVETYSFAELAPDYSDESVSTYKLTYTNNAAAQLVDQIVVEIYAADGQMVVQKSMSISEYLQCVLQDVTNLTDEQITLAIRLLNYGSACQTHFAYKTEQMANNFLNDEEKINTVDLEKLDSYEKESIQSVDGLTYYGTSLILGSSTTVRHYFAVEAGRDISEFTFSYMGEECAVHQKGVLYYVDLPAVDMYHAAEQQVLELTDGVQTGSIAYSVVNYAVKSGKINTDEPLGKLIRSLIAYQEMFAD